MLPFHEAALFWSTSLNNMIHLSVLKSRLELRRSAVAQMALQRRREGGRERGRGGGDGKEKRAVIPNWLGGVIGERLPLCMQKSLIFLFSPVWQLKRLEMTLSISQARIGDIYISSQLLTRRHGGVSLTNAHARSPVFSIEKCAQALFDSRNSPSGLASE